MAKISNIKQYWRDHRNYHVYLLEIEKLTGQIDDMMDKRSKMDKDHRKPLSDKIVALEHDRARYQGKAIQIKSALDEYVRLTIPTDLPITDDTGESLSWRDLIPWGNTILWIVAGLVACAIGCFLTMWLG